MSTFSQRSGRWFGLFVIFAWSGAATAAPPNILFLLADDQSYETIRALGHTDIDTPHLDRLVERGTTFTQAYNMGSWTGAVCVASRTMLITGRSLWRAQGIYATTDQERQAGRLWPQLMSQAGYRTAMTGKWHIRTDAAKCFETVQHVRAGMPKDSPAGYDRPRADRPDEWSPSDPKWGGFWEGGRHWSEVVADDAIQFIQASQADERPFFIYAAFNAPHDPRQSPQAFIDRYPLDRISLPQNYLAEYPFAAPIGCSADLRDEALAPFPRTEHAVRVHRQEYYALITHLDEQIGRILAALDQSGRADSTWIFFTADHGLAVGHHGLMGKQNMYDHSLRVPLLVVGPEAPAGKRIAAPVYLQDVMATALDLAGIAAPPQVEFQSLRPWLTAPETATRRETIYAAYLDVQRAVIHDGWKLIVYPRAKRLRLYHLTEDPQEQHDLEGHTEHAAQLDRLWELLRAQQVQLGDTLDLRASFADQFPADSR